jgi:metal-sulfur cluster biosynthetic enzyme
MRTVPPDAGGGKGRLAEWSIGEPAGTRVRQLLAGVVDPCSTASVLPMSIVELGLVRDVALGDGVLTVYLRLTSPSCMMVAYIAKEVVARLNGLSGVAEVRVAADEGLDWDPSMMDQHVAAERARRLVRLGMPARSPRPGSRVAAGPAPIQGSTRFRAVHDSGQSPAPALRPGSAAADRLIAPHDPVECPVEPGVVPLS